MWARGWRPVCTLTKQELTVRLHLLGHLSLQGKVYLDTVTFLYFLILLNDF